MAPFFFFTTSMGEAKGLSDWSDYVSVEQLFKMESHRFKV